MMPNYIEARAWSVRRNRLKVCGISFDAPADSCAATAGSHAQIIPSCLSQMNGHNKMSVRVPGVWPGGRPVEPHCSKKFWVVDSPATAALSAVYAWIMEHPDWLATCVKGYRSMKWDKFTDSMISIDVGGHYRRRPGMCNCPQNLALTCNFDRHWSKNPFLQGAHRCTGQRTDSTRTTHPDEATLSIFQTSN